MPEQILLQDLAGIWANPILPMVLAFIVVPIGLALLCVGSAYMGQILGRGIPCVRQGGRDRKRLRVPHRPRGVYRPHRWRNGHRETNGMFAFRRGRRGGR